MVISSANKNIFNKTVFNKTVFNKTITTSVLAILFFNPILLLADEVPTATSPLTRYAYLGLDENFIYTRSWSHNEEEETFCVDGLIFPIKVGEVKLISEGESTKKCLIKKSHSELESELRSELNSVKLSDKEAVFLKTHEMHLKDSKVKLLWEQKKPFYKISSCISKDKRQKACPVQIKESQHKLELGFNTAVSIKCAGEIETEFQNGCEVTENIAISSKISNKEINKINFISKSTGAAGMAAELRRIYSISNSNNLVVVYEFSALYVGELRVHAFAQRLR